MLTCQNTEGSLQKSTDVQIATCVVSTGEWQCFIHPMPLQDFIHSPAPSLTETKRLFRLFSKRDRARKPPSKSCQVISEDSHLVWGKWSSSHGLNSGRGRSWSLIFYISSDSTEHGRELLEFYLKFLPGNRTLFPWTCPYCKSFSFDKLAFPKYLVFSKCLQVASGTRPLKWDRKSVV